MQGQIFPRSAEKPETSFLSPDQVNSFHENGFLFPVPLLDQNQVKILREDLESMLQPEYSRRSELINLDVKEGVSRSESFTYFQNTWQVEESFHDLIFHPHVTESAGRLLDSSGVRFFHDQIFYKPARKGDVVAWHQDYSYWTRTVPAAHVTCYIALDDSDEENGCLHYIPKSHQWPLLPTVPLTGGEEDMVAIKKVLTKEQLEQFNPVPVRLKAGEASFHHSHTLHGSYLNKSTRCRRGVVLNYMAAHVKSNSSEPLMPGADPIPPGQVVQGDSFPLVLNKNIQN